jgi:hypothetical protein
MRLRPRTALKHESPAKRTGKPGKDKEHCRFQVRHVGEAGKVGIGIEMEADPQARPKHHEDPDQAKQVDNKQDEGSGILERGHSITAMVFRKPVLLGNLGRKLVENGLMAEEQAIEAMAKASEKGRTFTSHLVREKLIDAKGFALVASEDFGMPVIDLSAVNLKMRRPTSSRGPAAQAPDPALTKRGKRLFVGCRRPRQQVRPGRVSPFPPV